MAAESPVVEFVPPIYAGNMTECMANRIDELELEVSLLRANMARERAATLAAAFELQESEEQRERDADYIALLCEGAQHDARTITSLLEDNEYWRELAEHRGRRSSVWHKAASRQWRIAHASTRMHSGTLRALVAAERLAATLKWQRDDARAIYWGAILVAAIATVALILKLTVLA